MDWFLTTGHALGAAEVDLPAMIAANELHFLFTTGGAPDLTDGGHEFIQDLLDAGLTIETEVQLQNASYSGRALDTTDDELAIPDPGAGTDATHCVLAQKTGDNATSRLLGSEDIADINFDGEDDTLELAHPILRIGPS